jgi:hypothetical protein
MGRIIDHGMIRMTDNPPAGRRRTWVRVALAGPLAIIATLVVLAGLPLWLPGGAAGIDNLVVPLVLAPLIWAGLFFHACLDRNLLRVGAVAALLVVVHGGLVAQRLLVGSAPSETTL